MNDALYSPASRWAFCIWLTPDPAAPTHSVPIARSCGKPASNACFVALRSWQWPRPDPWRGSHPQLPPSAPAPRQISASHRRGSSHPSCEWLGRVRVDQVEVVADGACRRAAAGRIEKSQAEIPIPASKWREPFAFRLPEPLGLSGIVQLVHSRPLAGFGSHRQ